MVLISLITVCRNDNKRLLKTIESLKSFYDDQRFEHIVVDGGSTDKTFSVISDRLIFSNLRFDSKKDSGIYDAMNRGVLLSKSRFLIFLNCGDLMVASPDELYTSLLPFSVMDELHDFQIGCFPVRQFGIRGDRVLVPKYSSLHKMPISHQGMVFLKQFLLQNKYETSYQIAGDYDLYLRAHSVRIIALDPTRPFVAVEEEGVASNNPFNAYAEYLSIARNRLQGWCRIEVIARIGIRAMIVISLKLIFPKKWIYILKESICHS